MVHPSTGFRLREWFTNEGRSTLETGSKLVYLKRRSPEDKWYTDWVAPSSLLE